MNPVITELGFDDKTLALSISLFCAIVLCGVILKYMTSSSSRKKHRSPPKDVVFENNDKRLIEVVTSLHASQEKQMRNLTQEITLLKADINWLTSEKMIEQAISMAREGISAENISSDVGLSFDAAKTIQSLHKH